MNTNKITESFTTLDNVLSQNPTEPTVILYPGSSSLKNFYLHPEASENSYFFKNYLENSGQVFFGITQKNKQLHKIISICCHDKRGKTIFDFDSFIDSIQKITLSFKGQTGIIPTIHIFPELFSEWVLEEYFEQYIIDSDIHKSNIVFHLKK